MFKVVDLFCGPGGMSTGFEMAGFETICALDNDKYAIETFSKNHSSSASIVDLLKFDLDQLPDCDILIGGPPCIQFSSAKSNKTRNVLEGLLLVQVFLRAVHIKKPKYWIMENVPAIQKYLPKEIPLSFIGVDSDENLEINNMVELVAADYGVPQKRKRYLIGNFPTPPTTHQQKDKQLDIFINKNKPEWKTLGDVLDNFISPYSKNSRCKLKDINYDFELGSNLITDHFYDTGLSDRELISIKKSKLSHPYMGKLAWPDKKEQPARTIVSTQLGRETLIIKENLRKKEVYRRATVRECAILQSFPLTYQFFGNTYASKYRQVGDAVAPLLSFAIAKEIAKDNGVLIEMPKIEKEINFFSNKLASKLEKRKYKPNFNRNVKSLIPKKEVRGCRAEFISNNNNGETITYKGYEFKLPFWECILILGEGKNETMSFKLSEYLLIRIDNEIQILKNFKVLFDMLVKSLDEVLESLPTNKELFYNHVLGNYNNSPQYFVDKVLQITDEVFPAEKYSNSVLDMSQVIEHKKSHRIRVRVLAGAICGYYMSKKLN